MELLASLWLLALLDVTMDRSDGREGKGESAGPIAMEWLFTNLNRPTLPFSIERALVIGGFRPVRERFLSTSGEKWCCSEQQFLRPWGVHGGAKIEMVGLRPDRSGNISEGEHLCWNVL